MAAMICTIFVNTCTGFSMKEITKPSTAGISNRSNRSNSPQKNSPHVRHVCILVLRMYFCDTPNSVEYRSNEISNKYLTTPKLVTEWLLVRIQLGERISPVQMDGAFLLPG